MVMPIVNQKGGVGKTTTAINLGAALAEAGKRVLLVDLDAQGNATTGLGVERSTLDRCMYSVLCGTCGLDDALLHTSVPGLTLAPARMDLAAAEVELVGYIARETRVRAALEPVRDQYDFILIDSAPSLGLLTINSLAAGDEVLIPIQCEYYALEGLSQLQRIISLVRTSLNPALRVASILLTMYDSRLRLSAEVAADVRRQFGDLVHETMIPRSVRLSEAPGFGRPITSHAPDSKGARAYRLVAQEVIRRAESRPR